MRILHRRFFVSPDELKGYKRISTPKPFLAAMQRRRTKAQNLRYHLIAPLINEAQNIHDKAHRHKAAANIAAANHTTPKRILRLYYRYMATGSLMAVKPATSHSNPTYDWAIRTYYYSSKRPLSESCLRDDADRKIYGQGRKPVRGCAGVVGISALFLPPCLPQTAGKTHRTRRVVQLPAQPP